MGYIADQVSNINPVQIDGRTPLHNASANGHVEIVKHIMGVIVDKNLKDREGFTPMHMAAQQGHLEIFKVLIYHGANRNPKNNDGTSALDLADTNQEIQDLILNKSKKIKLRFPVPDKYIN